MNAFALILFAAPVPLIAALIFLGLIAAGIRRAERSSLRNSSARRLDSITRYVVGGIRTTARNDEDR